MNKDIAIRLRGISKRYYIHHDKPTLVERILNGKNEEFWALRSVNLEVRKGERLGVIGVNGSGKTTLLKVICGISAPTKGFVKTYGKIVSLIDLEAGFHPDLTGVQNVYMNASILGMGKDEVNQKLEEIISFADIGNFIDAPLFTYSEGMKMRLGFSVATHADPDILILDEGVGAGDKYFREKAMNKIKEMFKEKKTIVISSHWLKFIKLNCSRVILLNKGKLIKMGKPESVIKYYATKLNSN